MLLVTTPRFEPRSTGVRAIVAGLQVRAAAPTVGAVGVRIGVLSPAALWLWLRSNYGGELMLVGSHVSPLSSVGSIRS